MITKIIRQETTLVKRNKNNNLTVDVLGHACISEKAVYWAKSKTIHKDVSEMTRDKEIHKDIQKTL